MYDKSFKAWMLIWAYWSEKNHETVIIVSIYVNDFLIANKTMHKINCTKIVLNEVFQMSDFEDMNHCCFKVIRDWNKWMLMLNQASYIMKILSEEEMQNCSAVKVLMKLRLYITLNKINNLMKVSSTDLQWIVEN
jgi:hypothetical protein